MKKPQIYAVIGIVAILAMFAVSRVFSRPKNQKTPATSVQIAEPLAKTEVGKTLAIALTPKGDATLQYVVESAEIVKEIVVKGQIAKAAPKRVFLVLNVKITNQTKQGIQLNTRDYVRLAVKGKDDEWIAPDIHNDPVEVQALSTKYTRVGFPIDEGVREMKLSLGEISKEKTITDLKL